MILVCAAAQTIDQQCCQRLPMQPQVMEICSSGDQHLVVSYSRRGFQQTGDGHFSPVGGYHAGKDLVLILDVVSARYLIETY